MPMQDAERTRMNWRDLLVWRQPPVTDLQSLATFIDEHSAFLVQKGLYEYSRARAGHYAKVLFAEREFLDRLEASRWRAYPLGLAMVGEVVEGMFRRHAGEDMAQHLGRLRAFVLSVFDRYPIPDSLGEGVWRDVRAELAERLQLLGLHPPKRVIDIPEPYARTYWDLMPIHKEIRSSDFPTTLSYLKITLCNIHDELTRRADLAALARQLRDAGSAPSLSPSFGAKGEVGIARGERT
jgi:hypothetical protein